MPTKIRISKDMILDAAFEIVRQDGMEKLSNRELANKLKCSIRPIYYQFENVEEMQKELYIKIEKFFYKFLLDNMVKGIPQYKQVGNAVPVNLAYEIGLEIHKSLEGVK